MKKESYIRIRLTKEERAEIGRLATAMNMTISELVKRAITGLAKKVKLEPETKEEAVNADKN